MSFYKVYISSTYRDLLSYRKMVMESLHKVPNFKVVGMEYYTAEDTQPLDRCLQDVADCGIYVLILANRYGYMMDGQDKSVTHLEYLKAKELNKIMLVFKADNRDGRFLPDADEPGQPPSAVKQQKLNALKTEVGNLRMAHPEGFTSEYHLALQVMESLVRNPRVDFDGELPEDRKIFCDRANQVYDFFDLARKKQPFNVFLIQGEENDLGQSLVERLSRYYVGTFELVSVSYHEFITDPSYANFRRRLLNELGEKLLPNDPNPPGDPQGLLSSLHTNGTETVALVTSVSDAVQWQTGYAYLSTILGEFAEASLTAGVSRVYWFIVIDMPDVLQEQLQLPSPTMMTAPKLSKLKKEDVKSWISTYIDSDVETVLSVLNLCFGPVLKPPYEFDMYWTQNLIKKFIRRFNLRRRDNDEELLDILK